ncbi:uncharacterized protein BDZ99DRAFT_462427 [Mytilinidion resinicola]|uniref:RING-type domain-containing protein n=1 Tax=Mytilinidion resinicola TaxID=574789 RepID=A0A6A6YS05_9PEZI|nr:uncharacterized protein BDZ99DRAFT_462427 [Mytilinidion resinicola]KAF2811153.1 hypothetical protein BDZ99DRAFT_462427 [Mytilinidion resinicola]
MSSNTPDNSQAFIANNLTDLDANHPEVPDECPICHEDIGAGHTAVQITGIPNCAHIFGRNCLVSWLSCGRINQNTCPLCRTTLYQGRRSLRDPDPAMRRFSRARLELARLARLGQSDEDEGVITRDRPHAFLFNRMITEPRSLDQLEQDIQQRLVGVRRMEHMLQMARDNLQRDQEELTRRLENRESLGQARPEPMRSVSDLHEPGEVAPLPALRPEAIRPLQPIRRFPPIRQPADAQPDTETAQRGVEVPRPRFPIPTPATHQPSEYLGTPYLARAINGHPPYRPITRSLFWDHSEVEQSQRRDNEQAAVRFRLPTIGIRPFE